MSDANSMVDTLVFPMNPTSADWAHFQCWNEAEKSTAIEAYGFTADQLSVFQSIQFKTDDYTIESLAFAMFFDKLLGMKAELFDFYEGAATLIAQGTDTSIFHFEVLKDDFESMPGLDSARAGVSRTRWLMVSDNVEPIANDTDDECAFHFDEWITFRNPQAVSTMSSANEIAISPDENGHFACDESEGCMHGDSTWYPPQCEFPANACTVLLQFLPEHDSENRKFITENNLLIVIKYMGSALSSSGRANFKTFHEGPFTVIFQMRSIDSQSHIFGWTQIPLPPDKDISGEAGSFRLRPSWLSYTMPHLYILHEWLFVWFGDVDVQHVTNRIIEAIESGLEDSRDLRMRLVCDRLKEGGIGLMIMAQALSQSENITPVNCDGISDEALEFVVSKSHQELLFGPATDAAYYSQVDGIQFGVTAVYAKMFCIVEHGKDQDGGLYTFGYILSAFAAVFLCATALYTFKWRKEKIIMASSVKMLGVIFIGAAINLSYILFPRYDQLSHCYLRKYVLQIGIALMFAALEAKTRRLHVIQQSIKQLKRVKITDRDLILRVSGMTLFAVVYLTVLVLVRPIEIRQRVINRERMLICEWNETAETMYKLLFAFIVVALFMIGRISWSLRATNKLYNETKWIGLILYSTVLLIAGYLLVGLVEENSLRFILESYVVTSLVLLVISALMLPKFSPIVRGTVYNPDSLKLDTVTVSSSVLTQEDLRRMRGYLRKFGYQITREEDDDIYGSRDDTTSVSRTLTQSRLSSISRRNSLPTITQVTEQIKDPANIEVPVKEEKAT